MNQERFWGRLDGLCFAILEQRHPCFNEEQYYCYALDKHLAEVPEYATMRELNVIRELDRLRTASGPSLDEDDYTRGVSEGKAIIDQRSNPAILLEEKDLPTLTQIIDFPSYLPPEELYKELSYTTYGHKPYIRFCSGKQIETIGQRVYSDKYMQRFIVDHQTQCAYEFADHQLHLRHVTADDIDWAQLRGELDIHTIHVAKHYQILFHSFIHTFQDGKALFEWQLHPDSTRLYGLINTQGQLLTKITTVDAFARLLVDKN